jgi:hypothetical protein
MRSGKAYFISPRNRRSFSRRPERSPAQDVGLTKFLRGYCCDCWWGGVMVTVSAAPLRPGPVSWKRRFTRFGWVGLASQPETAAADPNRLATDAGTSMTPELRSYPVWSTAHLHEDSAQSARDFKPCLGITTRLQLGRRLKAIYDCDQAPMPDAIKKLLAQIEARLHCSK